MSQSRKILATFAVATALIAFGTARTGEASNDFDCARQATDGPAAPCPTPEADRAEANFLGRARAEVERTTRAIGEESRKPQESPAQTQRAERDSAPAQRLGVALTSTTQERKP